MGLSGTLVAALVAPVALAPSSLPGCSSCSGGVAAAAGPVTTVASRFAPGMYFNQAVDTAPLDPSSATVIRALVGNGGWGGGSGLQIDTSIDVYEADATSRRVPFVRAPRLIVPDSDVPASVPVAPGTAASSGRGGGSGAPGFESDTSCTDGGDCHYLVVDPASHQLVEVYGATFDGTSFSTLTDGRSVAVWDWTRAYAGHLRGDVCTSADASGGLVAPLLFTAEEVAAGHIDHAIRFILPNTRIQDRQYVRPATHGTGNGTARWALHDGVPYGARFRLHAGFDVSRLPPGAQIVARALMKYGMILSDGGNLAFTAKSDRFSATKWAGLLGSHDLRSLQPTDFDMVDGRYGTDGQSAAVRHDFTSFDCVRSP
jgi:serine/threonine-protein kinase